jgi:two-component system, OmpR family, alkaline phosphatase synthesis response regulator PhoP
LELAKTVLVVDDEPGIVTIVRDYLERAGFRVLTAGDGNTALRLARLERPNLMVLDLMMPGIDGLDVLRTMRTDPALHMMSVIMLTARVDEADRLVGLELGADDYVTKPFSPREVVARVRAVLRRAEGSGSYSPTIRAGNLTIDLQRRTVRNGDAPVDLTATEFDLLVVLARNPGRPFTRAQLVQSVYDSPYDGYDRTIDAHVKNLRRKLEEDVQGVRYIQTVYGVGYRFAEFDEE